MIGGMAPQQYALVICQYITQLHGAATLGTSLDDNDMMITQQLDHVSHVTHT